MGWLLPREVLAVRQPNDIRWAARQEAERMMHDGYGMMHGSWMMLFIAVLVIVPVWRICAKAGYSGLLSLLIVVPIANVLLLYFLGFSEWPLERRSSAGAAPTP